jgi:hypothetical protein
MAPGLSARPGAAPFTLPKLPAEVQGLIRRHIPDEEVLRFALWSRTAVGAP